MKIFKVLSKKKLLFSMMISIIIISTVFTVKQIRKSITTTSDSADDNAISLPIIMYHSILKPCSKLNRFVISNEELENDLKYITEHGYQTIFINELINYVYSDGPLPSKPIILTFDDGYYNNYLYAFPLMKKYNCKMVISPIGQCTDMYTQNKNTCPTYAHVSWDNLKEMQDSGLVEIQNHSYNMHTRNKGRIGIKIKKGESLHDYKKSLLDDIGTFQEKANCNLHTVPTTFVYPFGAICRQSIDIIKSMGFKATLSCENKMNLITHDPECLYGLYRFIRPTGIKSEKFFKSKDCL